MSFEDELRTLVRARYPLIWVNTHEEERVLRYVQSIAADPKGDGSIAARPLFLWAQSTGMVEIGPKGDRRVVDGEATHPGMPGAIPRVIKEAEEKEDRIFVFRDLHRFLNEQDAAYRFLRDASHTLRDSHVTLIVTSPIPKLTPELEKDVVMLDLPLPTADELRVRLEEVLSSPTLKERGVELPTNGAMDAIVKAGLGLTENEFAGAVKESLVRGKKVDPHVILRYKEQVIRKAGVVELFSSVEGLESVGGLGLLRQWVVQRALAFSEKAARYRLSPTKGLLLTGPPGTGKTLTAKAMANHLGVPLLAVHADRIFGSLVGETERNLRQVLNLADAVSPCVLFIDEGEKFIAGSSGAGAAGDSGVARRMLGSLLTYMSDHTTPVLVVMTANDPMGIPPELLRRFDGVFFVDLPQAEERTDIVTIHLKKKGREPKKFDVAAIVRATDGFSGAEIEKAINEGLFRAFSEKGREVTTNDIGMACARITPVSKSRREDVERMREWGKVNAEPASERAQRQRVAGPEV